MTATDLGRRLDGRTALVTGAGAGIGRAIARRLAAEGATLAVNDIDAAACADVVAELEAAGAEAYATPGSVSDPAATEAMIARIERAGAGLDILVNNAGVLRDVALHRMTDDDWHRVQEVNLFGTFAMCRAASRLLRGERDAVPAHHRKVVNLSSNVALHGAPGTVNYSAAKAGVVGLTYALAREWAGRRVNVNAIAPGLIAGTNMTAAKDARLIEQTAARVPLGRAGTPEDIAAAAAFLASPDADFMTGQVLELHGGLDVLG